MAERLPPNSSSHVNVHDPLTSQSPTETYVVQIPKNQIYRVPPPENARIVEEHRNPETKKQAFRCSSQLCFIVFIGLVIVSIALTVGFTLPLLKAKKPQFKVQRLVVKNLSQSIIDYDLTLSVHNPDVKSGILYLQGGVTSLFFQEEKMAAGKFPTFYQEEKKSTEIGIHLKGSKISMPHHIKKSIQRGKPKVNIFFYLKMDIPARMRTSSFTTGDAELVITCDVKVDTLAKGTKILSQHCQNHH